MPVGNLQASDQLIRTAEGAYQAFKDEDELGLDIETSGLNPWKDKIAVVQLSGARSGKIAVLHLRGAPIPDALRALLQDPSKTFLGHNQLGFDVPFIANAGVDVFRAKFVDTMVVEQCLLPAGRRDVRVNLKDTLERRTGIRIRKDMNHEGWMWETLDEAQLQYAAGDVADIHLLKKEQYKRAKELGVMGALQTELDLAPTVLRMTLNGLPFDHDRFALFQRKQVDQANDAAFALRSVFGEAVNLNSVPQLKAAFAGQGLTLDSTAKATLIKHCLMADIPPDGSTPVDDLLSLFNSGIPAGLIGILLTHRTAATRLKMYKSEWVDQYVYDGRLHARFLQLGTDTGRFSSRNPNMQQLPRDMRFVMRAAEGLKMVWADYPQIEVRVMAHKAGDDALMEACNSEDLHKTIAAEAYGLTLADITKEQKRDAKGVTFCKLFGGGVDTAWNYVRNNGSQMTRPEMERLFTRFDRRFSGVRKMIDNAYFLAKTNDKVTITLPTGLKRILIGKYLRGSVILNTRVQGTAAAGMKFALLECQRRGLDRYLGAAVHDELVGCVPDAYADEFAAELAEAMVVGMQQVLPLPLTVKPDIAQAWGSVPPGYWMLFEDDADLEVA